MHMVPLISALFLRTHRHNVGEFQVHISGTAWAIVQSQTHQYETLGAVAVGAVGAIAMRITFGLPTVQAFVNCVIFAAVAAAGLVQTAQSVASTGKRHGRRQFALHPFALGNVQTTAAERVTDKTEGAITLIFSRSRHNSGREGGVWK